MTWISRRLFDAATIAVYFGYYVADERLARAQIYYVMCGAFMALTGMLLAHGFRPSALASALMVTEGAQQAICGALTFGELPGCDLCLAVGGSDVYRALGSLTLAGMVTLWLSRRQK